MYLVVHPFALSLRVWLHNSFPNSKTSRRGSYLLHSYLHPRAAAANAVSVVAKVSHINNKQKRNVLCFSVLCFPWQLHGRNGRAMQPAIRNHLSQLCHRRITTSSNCKPPANYSPGACSKMATGFGHVDQASTWFEIPVRACAWEHIPLRSVVSGHKWLFLSSKRIFEVFLMPAWYRRCCRHFGEDILPRCTAEDRH